MAVPLEDGIYADDYYISLYPHYPPRIGDKVTIRLRTFSPAQKVTLYSDRQDEIPMAYREGYWWGKFQVPEDYKTGSHFFHVWIRYPVLAPPKPPDLFSRIISYFGFGSKTPSANWSKSMLWYKMIAPPLQNEIPVTSNLVNISTSEEGSVPIVTGEAIEIKVVSPEASPFIIKGAKTLSFSSKSIEGTKEGFIPGVSREESLRLNISGKSDDVEVDANLISTSTAGTSQVSQHDDRVSLLLRKGSTEAYLGDFTADLNETEFTGLVKVLSGVRVKGDYDRWGFNALYSSPRGESKYKRSYGDGTQGPYKLDYAPVVINSEIIHLDGILQKRGDDYAIDYQAGTITFINKTIDPKSILTINYDYSQNVYQHSTYGLRLTSRPFPNTKIGATYLNDSDSLTGAADIRGSMTGTPVDPQGHYVVGADGSLVSENLTAMGELAYSSKTMDLLNPSTSEITGKAIKLELSSQLGPFGIALRGKRIGAGFNPIADPNPKRDLTDYGVGLSFRPGGLFGTQVEQNREKYEQGGVVYQNARKSLKASLTPERWPSLEYSFSEDEASNDPVTGDTIERIITRNSAETIYRRGFLSADLKGTQERWLNRSPSEEVTNYKRINLGIATAGIEKLSLTSNVELENREEPSGDIPYRKTYRLNLSTSPSRAYLLSGSIEYLEDSAQGTKNVADISYRAEPNEVIRTEGKYSVASVSEVYATTEAVSKVTGSFSLDLRPTSYLRARYLFKPNYTRITRTDTISYNNEQSQVELNLLPLPDVMVGALYKVGHGFNIYKLDAPNYSIKDNTQDTDSILYTLKMAPFRIFSTEFNYLLENGATTQRITSEPLSYLPGKSFGKKFDVAIRSSLSERFSVDSRYTYQRNTQGSGEADQNIVNSASHAASLKGIWNLNDNWSFSLSGAFTRTTDNLATIPLSYTYSPGLGFIYRNGERVRVDFDYTFSKSYSGATTELNDLSLRVKYSLSDYVNITIRGEQQISRSPDYKLTDISGNVEINL